MKIAVKTAVIAMTVIALAGCGTGLDPNPPFAVTPRYEKAPTTLEKVTAWRASARTLSEAYTNKYKQANWTQLGFDVPVLVGAAAVVGGLVFQANRDLLAGFGLFSGTALATRSFFAPASTPDAYLRGRGALVCIESASADMLRVADVEALKKQQGRLGDLIAGTTVPSPKAIDLLTAKPEAPDDLEDDAKPEFAAAKAEFEAAQAELVTAHNDAKNAKKLLDEDIAAANTVPDALATAIQNVDQKVARLVKREPLDFNATVDAIIKTATDVAERRQTANELRDKLAGRNLEPKTSTAGNASDNSAVAAVKALTERANFYASQLKKATAETLDVLPKFAESKAAVNACVAQLG